jgi:hypothetical protein
MPNPVFPVLAGGTRPDSSQYEVSLEDPSMSAPTEGGYEFTRARHTRAPRRSFKVGYRQLTDAQKVALVNFWDSTVKGGSVIFDWLNHEDNVTYAVRFKGELTFKYVGMGNLKLWDCSFAVKQA